MIIPPPFQSTLIERVDCQHGFLPTNINGTEVKIERYLVFFFSSFDRLGSIKAVSLAGQQGNVVKEEA